MVNLATKDLWDPAGILLGFQITLFTWRIARESSQKDKMKITWLTPADYLGIVGMGMLIFGVILFPMLGFVSIDSAIFCFGLGAVLFAGQSLGLAGHYDLFFRPKNLDYRDWFPNQERFVVILTIAITLFSLVIWNCRSD